MKYDVSVGLKSCAEGMRWDDLVRWKAGKLLEDLKTILGSRDPDTGERGYIRGIDGQNMG